METTKQFLTIAIESHRTIQDREPRATTWTMGVFNLQGIAPGHQHLPQRGSHRLRLSKRMLQLLDENQLAVVSLPPTHVKGVALDVYITSEAHKHKANNPHLSMKPLGPQVVNGAD